MTIQELRPASGSHQRFPRPDRGFVSLVHKTSFDAPCSTVCVDEHRASGHAPQRIAARPVRARGAVVVAPYHQARVLDAGARSCTTVSSQSTVDTVPAWVLALAGVVLALVLFAMLALSGGSATV